MPLFRKKETYNEQMLREAGLDRVVLNTPAPPPQSQAVPDNRPRAGHGGLQTNWLKSGWDTTTAALAQVEGDVVEFTVLPNGDLIVTYGGEGDFSPLADAIEEHIQPPYKAHASRDEGNRWVIGAKEIEVEQFVFPNVDALELSQSDGVTELRVDGEPSDATPPATLQSLGVRTGSDFAIKASRIDGDYWEVKVSPL